MNLVILIFFEGAGDWEELPVDELIDDIIKNDNYTEVKILDKSEVSPFFSEYRSKFRYDHTLFYIALIDASDETGYSEIQIPFDDGYEDEPDWVREQYEDDLY